MKQLLQFLTTGLILLYAVAGICADAGSMMAPAGHQNAAGADNEQQGAIISGKVVETMNSGGYSYICLEKAGVKTWVAVPEMKVAVGQKLSFPAGGEMPNFTSKTLNRTFESIIFTSGPIGKPAGKEDKLAGKKSGGSKAAVAVADAKISVTKATGADAYTVGELYAQQGKLNKKKVVVRGKVVKVSAGIMGKNWIHLQDGTGDAAKGNNDLVVTSQDLPEIGDVVTASGILAKDKDFGGGYRYAVIVEEAKVKK